MTSEIIAPAPLFRGDGRIEFVDHRYREPRAGELLIAPRANAICGTDRNFWYGGADNVPGHETAGVVIGTGEGTTVPLGTRGVVFLMDYCGRCRSCLLGATNQCLNKRADMGIADDGGFGPYEIVHETNFFPITDDIDFTTATMLLDVMGTSGHAIGRAQLLRPDIESVYISGAGPIGLGLLVMSQLLLGPDLPVHISDVSPWRRDFAATFGGIPVDASDPAAMRTVGEPDVAFDSSGKQVARRAALDVLAKRGVLVCVGHGETVTLDVSRDLLAPEHAVLGSEYFRFDDLPRNLELLREHQDFIARVITHRLPVTELDRAFELFLAGETGKVVIEQEEA
ncbi:alcohol dehydrogenase [Curtobacterium sp. MCBD17_013]|uniref:alcohol dehydrogenase catalytic domain-containing protein n=1 Tax=Curtobacterium sp. MCBD17_013 TaxID=2175668 RepID=UPI000DA6E375|nr:alcohol dehydrogenase catalytic domain-containing protein [Curtobacterium sp. MCBD17_013]PZF65150.1 alcohol dehydrogenase [Curtobacterium sp. MCBD17_013]